ncbi:MAG: ATP-binding cassette domain-containing protein [Gemmatimonadota bacterium]
MDPHAARDSEPQRASAAPILEVDCVAKRFGGRTVLSSASLRAVPGRVTALVGRNGAGKSTLLRIATGTVAPDGGYVRLRGCTLERVSLSSIGRHGVFLLPDRDLLLPGLPVGAQIRGAAAVYGVPVDVGTIAGTLGIAGCLDKRPATLSGGERRRAEVAVALARRPDVLIADEPLRGINPIDAGIILGALRALAQEGAAVVVTGHETPLLLPACDHVTWCNAGTTREFSSEAAAMNDFAFRRDYLPAMPPRVAS